MKITRHIGTPDGVPLGKLSVLKSAYLQHCDLSDGVADHVVTYDTGAGQAIARAAPSPLVERVTATGTAR